MSGDCCLDPLRHPFNSVLTSDTNLSADGGMFSRETWKEVNEAALGIEQTVGVGAVGPVKHFSASPSQDLFLSFYADQPLITKPPFQSQDQEQGVL